MKPLKERIREQWPLSIVVVLVLALGYAGWWPAIPLPYQPPQASPTGSSRGLIVEWLMSPNLQNSSEVFPAPSNPEYFQVPSQAAEQKLLLSHPQMIRHEGKLVVSWATHPTTIDGVGQWVGGAWSEDGQTWQSVPSLFRPLSEQHDTVPGNIILLPAPFQKVEERLFALAHVYEVAGFGAPTSTNFATPETNQPTSLFPKPVLESRGYLVREILSGVNLGPVWWFGGQKPTQELMDFDESAADEKMVATLIARFEAAASRPANEAEFADPQIVAIDGKVLSWPTTLNWEDDLNYRLWSVSESQEPLYMQLSIDQGKSWSTAQSTNVPNAGNQTLLGRIKGGPVFLIGNQSNTGRSDAADTLTLSMAFEWLQFTHSYTIRSVAAVPRLAGQSEPSGQSGQSGTRSSAVRGKEQKRHRGIQASSWLLDEHSLWIAYSVNSEMIELCRIPILSLAPISGAPPGPENP